MKFIRFFLLLTLPALVFAQKKTTTKPSVTSLKKLVHEYMLQNKTEWKLTDADISNWSVSSSYTDSKTGTTYMYINQQVKGINIFNAISSISIKDGKINSFAKNFFADAAGKTNTTQPSSDAVFAIRKTAEHLGLTIKSDPKFISSKKSLNRSYYSCADISKDKIRVDLVIQPVKQNLSLAWDVNIRMLDGKHWWNVRIDAVNGDVLKKNDWTVHCDFNPPIPASSSSQAQGSTNPAASISPSSVPSYRVFALPLESPGFGASSLVANPSDANASPYGWHDTNGAAGAEYTITRGNNVFAYDDIANRDAPGTSPNGTTSLTFDYPINFNQQPVNYLDASVTNLFYINNMIHDRLFHYGFDEASGNFQQTNYSGGGAGNDYVLAECQDGGGTDNANFATPDDGQNGRMQMYLWTGSVQMDIHVNSPAPISGSYIGVQAGFGPTIIAPITGNVVLVDDGNGVTSDACESIINGAALSGKIALIDRGTCQFVSKVLEAQNAGAIAVLIINNSGGSPFAMGDNGNGGTVTIPAEMISLADGTIFKNTLGGGTPINATLNPPPSGAVDNDGSLDNGIVVHEYGHGVSTRLTGGPLNSNCLFNGEEGGEGWSDYFALMFTMKAGDVGTQARGMGTFAIGEPSTGYGIRRYPYSTDMNIDPETYGFLAQSGEVHDIGEVWCTTLWEMTWGLIDQFGFNSDWINNTTSGNSIALRLVMEGLKLQPCSPGFLDARDAILKADDNLYSGVHKCLIWEAFAKRGMGSNAVQGSSDVAGDETEDFSLPSVCLIPTNKPTANFDADITSTCHGTIHFRDSSINIPQAWHWNFGDGDTANVQNPVHTYTAPGLYNVTLVVTNSLGFDSLLRPAYIHITMPAMPTVAGNTSICGGTTTTLTATVSGGNSAQWSNANDSVLFVGNVFTTPVITSPVTYHLFQFNPTPLQNVGPVDGTFGAGGYYAGGSDRRLLFTTYAPIRLKSVLVDASGLANRTINLYGPGNTLIQSLTISIPNSQSRVILNFDIPVPGNYQIGAAPGNNLFRNTASASYPYSINGLVSITSSNYTSDPLTPYYFFYNWEVQELPCYSPPLPVNVTLDPGSHFNYSAGGLTVQFSDSSTGNPVAWSWDFGNGSHSTNPNPSVNYLTAGSYTVSLAVTNSNGCSSTSTQIVTVTSTGINPVPDESFQIYYSGRELVVKQGITSGTSKISVYDPIGKLLLNTSFSNDREFRKTLSKISPEFILVNLMSGERFVSKKIILAH